MSSSSYDDNTSGNDMPEGKKVCMSSLGDELIVPKMQLLPEARSQKCLLSMQKNKKQNKKIKEQKLLQGISGVFCPN